MVKTIITINASKDKNKYKTEKETTKLNPEEVTENFFCNVVSILCKIINNNVAEVEPNA